MANNQIVYTIKVNGDASSGQTALQQIGNALNQAGNQAQTLFNQFQQLGQATNVSVNVPVNGANGQPMGNVNASIKGGQQAANAVQNVNNAAQQANTQVQKVTQNAASLGKQFKATWDQALFGLDRMFNGLRMVAQGVMELGFLLSTFLTAPLISLFKSGFQGAVEFEAQMARVRKALTDMPDDKFKTLTDRIRNLSKITPTTQTELAGIAEEIGQLGVTGNGVYRMLNLVNKVIIGTGVSAQGLATDLGRVAAALGIDLNTEEGMRQLESLTSVMDYVAKKTSTDMDGILASVKDAAVIGGMLKETLKPEELIAGLGVLITSGVDPSAAGTVLQRFFVQTMKNADKFAEFMKGFERQIRDENGKIVDSFQPYADAEDVIQRINDEPIQVLTDAVVALNTATDEDKAKAIKNFMDAVGFVGGRLGAMGANADDLQKLLAGVNEEMAHALTLQMDYERMLTNTDSAMKIFKNNINDLGITIGNYLMPYVNELIEYAIPIVQDLGKAFEGAKDSTKLLVVAIPLIGAVLGPVLFILGTLSHFLMLTATGFITIAKGVGIYAFKIGELISKLGIVQKVINPIKKGLGLLGTQTAAAGGAAGGAAGMFGTLLATLLKFVGGIVGIPLAIAGVLKILQGFGLNVSTFFTSMADRAKAWGERLMLTYGGGILSGAVKVVTKIVTTVANMIARFFEAHSPPEEGPLSTIDQWGSALMNTYLKGFLEADFDILSEVGSRIERAFEIFASLQNLDLESLNDTFMAFRENIAQVIDTFNKTGQVAEDVLSKIGTNLGTLGKDIQDLIRYWLKYKQLQEKLAALERKKKDTLKNYDSEIARIAKMNITAEEKAELIRQAQMNRDDELRTIEQEKKAAEEEAAAAKDKVDWQKEYIDAQLEFLDMLKKKKGSGSGDGGMEEVDFDTSKLDDALAGTGSTVQDLGEEFNSWSEKIDRARGALEQFKNAFNGKNFGEGMSAEDIAKWQKEDPEGFKRAKELYDLGLKARDIWEKVSAPVKAVAGFFSGMKEKTDLLKTAMDKIANSQFMAVLQQIFDAAAENIDVFDPLTRAFDTLNDSLSRANLAFGNAGVSWQDVLKVIAVATATVFALVTGIISILINLIMVVVEVVARIIGHVVENVSGFLSGAWELLQGIWDIIVGIFTDNPTKIIQGLLKFGEGAYRVIQSAFMLITQIVGDLLEGVVDLVIRLLTDLIAWILRLFGQDDIANKIQEWGSKAIEKVREWLDGWYAKMNEFKDKLHEWVGGILAWLDKIPGVNINMNANLNTTTTSSSGGPAPQYHAAGGITLPGKPNLGWVGEGHEQEAIIPLSKLPGLMESMYGSQLAGAGNGIVLNINNPVVREDQDIDKIANAVARKLGRKTNNSSRLGNELR